MNPFNRYNPDPTGKLFYGGGDVGMAAQAAIYAASNIVSWTQAKKMPKLQAQANQQVLNLQKAHYDQITTQQRNKLNNFIEGYINSVHNILNGGAFEDAYSDVPVAAEYVPVDTWAHTYDSNTVNQNLIGALKDQVSWVNRLHEQNDLQHALALDPRFMVELDVQSQSVFDLMRGVISTGDALEVIGDQAEQAAMLGRIGNTRKTNARDLGISRLRAQTAGRREFREITTWANSSVSPMSRQHDIYQRADTTMQSGLQRLHVMIQQSQLIQQSLQNKNNALATKAPYKMAKLQAQMTLIITRLQAKMNEALLTNNFIPNYASVVVPNIDNTANLVGGIGQAVMNANSSHFFGGPSGAQEGYVGGRTGESLPMRKGSSVNENELKYSGAGE